MNTRLCVVRHGETAWNAEHRVQGQLDVPLNAIGQAQAEATAKVLGEEKFSAIYSSDLARAQQTAQPAARLLAMSVALDRDLRERHYGIFERLTYAEVKQKFPGDYARFEAREPGYDFRTGESLSAFSERSIAAISRIADRHAGESVLVFTHGGVLDMLQRFITGSELSTQRGFGIPNAGLNRIELVGRRWQIRAWADTAHLDDALDDLP
ncbi:MAG TPA: histidine phosphatase family protein [Burkholderiales bacterium]|nr:histidine phosphatase family protein [Burkholderiales bacterium]